MSNDQNHMIELYIIVLQSQVDKHQEDLTLSPIYCILSIDGWCSRRLEMKKLVNTPHARPSSPYDRQYFSLSQRVIITDKKCMCIVVTAVNSIGFLDGVDAVWNLLGSGKPRSKG